MIKELVKVASKLDALGLTKEADYLDKMIAKIAGRDGYWSASKQKFDGASLFAEDQDYDYFKECGYSDRDPSRWFGEARWEGDEGCGQKMMKDGSVINGWRGPNPNMKTVSD